MIWPCVVTRNTGIAIPVSRTRVQIILYTLLLTMRCKQKDVNQPLGNLVDSVHDYSD